MTPGCFRQTWKLTACASVRAPVCTPVLEDGFVPSGAPILLIQRHWLHLIIAGVKTIEIRRQSCRKPTGTRIYYGLSGSGAYVFGSAVLAACHGPLDTRGWLAHAPAHCVDCSQPPFATTFAWEVSSPVAFRNAVKFSQKGGMGMWTIMD